MNTNIFLEDLGAIRDCAVTSRDLGEPEWHLPNDRLIQLCDIIVDLQKEVFEQQKLMRSCKFKLSATEAVLSYREDELLERKGPCSNKECRLHFAHTGPCDRRISG